MTPEAKVKRNVTNQLKLIGAYYFYPATGGYGKSGVPDIVGCYNGNFFGIECKAGKNTPTALQQKNLDDIATAGWHCRCDKREQHDGRDVFDRSEV